MTLITIKFRRDTSSRWNAADPVLAPGEPGYEIDTDKFKIGNGTARWSDLVYFKPGDTDNLHALYEQLRTQVTQINNAAYDDDDGPSLFLLYENAKV